MSIPVFLPNLERTQRVHLSVPPNAFRIPGSLELIGLLGKSEAETVAALLTTMCQQLESDTWLAFEWADIEMRALNEHQRRINRQPAGKMFLLSNWQQNVQIGGLWLVENSYAKLREDRSIIAPTEKLAEALKPYRA